MRMHCTRLVTTGLGLLLLNGTYAYGAVIRVQPGSAQAVTEAVARARPGDVIRLLPGTYKGSIEVKRSGEPENPIVIVSDADDPARWAVIDGGAEPGSRKRNQGFRLEDASWVEIRNIRFVNCWTDVITIARSSYVTVRGCEMRDCGQHAVAARGLDTHHILVEDCSWSQDKRIWAAWDWAELHHGKLRHYNGGFYGRSDAAGGAVIRRNSIRYAFNGFRWWLRDKKARKAQSNIEVYENRFEYCLDNCIEPEVFTSNLHVYHNVFDSCPNGVFSIDKVDGGPIHVYGNVGRWDGRGGTKSGAWTIYKFAKYERQGYLDEPLFIYHNSWRYMSAFGATAGRYKKGDDHVRHLNNAYTYEDASRRKNFGLIDWQGKDGRFDYDCSIRPWPTNVLKNGYEKHGIVADPKFVDDKGGDFRLQSGSPCIDRGKVIDGFTQWYLGAAPDIGAYEGGRLVYGAPFRHIDPPGGATYKEKPRIVRCFSRGRQLAIFWSTNLAAGVKPGAVRISMGGEANPVVSATRTKLLGTLLLTLVKPVAHGTVIDLRFLQMPRGANGELTTMWGANLKVVGIPEDATLVGEMAKVFGKGRASAANVVSRIQFIHPAH